MKVGDRVKLKSTISWASQRQSRVLTALKEQLFEDALIFSWGFCYGVGFAFFLAALAH
jgi:hypothetical protein